MVRSLGADHVIDYTQEDFTQNGQRYDLILDVVGNLAVADCTRALAPKGIFVLIGFTTMAHMFKVMLLGAWVSKTSRQKIAPMTLFNRWIVPTLKTYASIAVTCSRWRAQWRDAANIPSRRPYHTRRAIAD